MSDWIELEPESCDSVQPESSNALWEFVQTERERKKKKGGKRCRKTQGFNRRRLPSTGFSVVGPGIFRCTTRLPLSQQRASFSGLYNRKRNTKTPLWHGRGLPSNLDLSPWLYS